MNKLSKILLLSVLSVLTAGSAWALPGMPYMGTGEDGVMILPKELAMRCQDFDLKKDDAVSKCLTKLLVMSKGDQRLKGERYTDVFREAYRQMNDVYNNIALNKQSIAADVDEQIEKEVFDETSLDGAFKDEGAKIRKKQEQNVNLSAMTTKAIVDLTDVYSSQMIADGMSTFYEYEFSNKAAPVEGEEDEEK